MNIKKMKIPIVFLALAFVAYIIVALITCYRTTPTIKEGEFPFSITYEYKGETNTLKGVYKCEFIGSRTILNEHNRYWDGKEVYENPESKEYPFIIEQTETTSLSVHPHMYAGYFMGDPLHADYYEAYGSGKPEPYAEYYDYANETSLDDENREEGLNSTGFKIVDFSYAEPITNNSFYFSGILFAADNVTLFMTISLVFLILCLIFVRRDKEFRYSELDKFAVILNCIVGILALPFISIVCMLYDINGSGTDLLSQIAYNIPPVAITCLAFSVVFRRKGLRKASFFIQFGGIALFVLLLVAEAIF